MSDEAKVVSKVLVHETDENHMSHLKNFFTENNLIGLKAEHFRNIFETLKSSIDLGAILLCEEVDKDGKSGLDLAIDIHKIRQELPIFLRRKKVSTMDDLPEKSRLAIAGVYQAGNPAELKSLIDRYLFNTYYPMGFIRGIQQISEQALAATFKDTVIEGSIPFLIRDRIIYGELYSMIPIEGNWCRGYMMLQTESVKMGQMIQQGRTALPSTNIDFPTINSLMSEVTNMIWGKFKARFFSSEEENKILHRIQVPIIVNHERKYITFGTENPQLSFEYKLKDPTGKTPPITLWQKFVFHLGWAPDEFKENAGTVDNLVETGELELF